MRETETTVTPGGPSSGRDICSPLAEHRQGNSQPYSTQGRCPRGGDPRTWPGGQDSPEENVEKGIPGGEDSLGPDTWPAQKVWYGRAHGASTERSMWRGRGGQGEKGPEGQPEESGLDPVGGGDLRGFPCLGHCAGV